MLVRSDKFRMEENKLFLLLLQLKEVFSCDDVSLVTVYVGQKANVDQ